MTPHGTAQTATSPTRAGVAPPQRQLPPRDQDRDQDPGREQGRRTSAARAPRWNTNGLEGLGSRRAARLEHTVIVRPWGGESQPERVAGRVAVVAGGTRGAGRGIAVALGAPARPSTDRASSGAGRRRWTAPRRSTRRRELVDAAGGPGSRCAATTCGSREVDALRAARRARGGPARRPRQRHLGRRRARRAGTDVLGTRPRGRAARLAQLPSDAPDHVAPVRYRCSWRPGAGSSSRSPTATATATAARFFYDLAKTYGDPPGARPSQRTRAARRRRGRR